MNVAFDGQQYQENRYLFFVAFYPLHYFPVGKNDTVLLLIK